MAGIDGWVVPTKQNNGQNYKICVVSDVIITYCFKVSIASFLIGVVLVIDRKVLQFCVVLKRLQLMHRYRQGRA